MSWQQVEQDPLVVQLHFFHVVSLLLRLHDISNHTHTHIADPLKSGTDLDILSFKHYDGVL